MYELEIYISILVDIFDKHSPLKQRDISSERNDPKPGHQKTLWEHQLFRKLFEFKMLIEFF